MPEAVKQLCPSTALTTSDVATPGYYVVPSQPQNAQTEIRGITIANTDTSARTYTVNVVPVGGSASASNRIFPAIAIPASTTNMFGFGEGELVLPAGTFISAKADSAALVNIEISGIEK